MTATSTERLRQITNRLTEIATALGSDDLEDARAVELAAEAAHLVEEATGMTDSEVTRLESEE